MSDEMPTPISHPELYTVSERTFWDRLTEERFSWLDIIIAVVLFVILPSFLLALIPW